MKFDNVCFPLTAAWSSPFVRWQGPTAETDSYDLAESAARRGLERSGVSWPVTEVVLGQTVPQPDSFFGPTPIAARLGFEDVGGPLIAQACATSVACIHAAASSQQINEEGVRLVLTADRVSNSPELIWPAPGRPGGAPVLMHWILDNFVRDPWAGRSMLGTAEKVAAEAGFTKRDLDEITAVRYSQYEDALRNERAFQRRYMVAADVGSKRERVQVAEDVGVRSTVLDDLERLAPVEEGGVVSYGAQTHPADGTAGFVVTSPQRARALGAEGPLVHVVATGFARVAKSEMPKAPVPAAERALADAGVSLADMAVVKTHNPFAVNDLWFARATGYDADAMNPYGCSLVYGHPIGPTGQRAIIELAHAVAERGGGMGLFTGCAAGDIGAAVVLKVDA